MIIGICLDIWTLAHTPTYFVSYFEHTKLRIIIIIERVVDGWIANMKKGFAKMKKNSDKEKCVRTKTAHRHIHIHGERETCIMDNDSTVWRVIDNGEDHRRRRCLTSLYRDYFYRGTGLMSWMFIPVTGTNQANNIDSIGRMHDHNSRYCSLLHLLYITVAWCAIERFPHVCIILVM